VELGHLADDLVKRRIDESVELDLHHRAVAAVGEAHGGANDGRFGQGRIHHPVRAEVLLQPVGYPEHTAEGADVLPHQHDFGIVLEGFAQARVDRAGKGHLGHQRAPSSEAAPAGSPKVAR
jgi:hypothetical protein